MDSTTIIQTNPIKSKQIFSTHSNNILHMDLWIYIGQPCPVYECELAIDMQPHHLPSI